MGPSAHDQAPQMHAVVNERRQRCWRRRVAAMAQPLLAGQVNGGPVPNHQ